MSVRVIYECPNVSLSSGLIRGCFGAALGFKTGENETFLRIYGFEGEAGRRGRARRGTGNQNVAGNDLTEIWSLGYDSTL